MVLPVLVPPVVVPLPPALPSVLVPLPPLLPASPVPEPEPPDVSAPVLPVSVFPVEGVVPVAGVVAVADGLLGLDEDPE